MGKIRFVEVHGERYAVGMGFIEELTRAYNERHGGDFEIPEVLTECFGNVSFTAKALENMGLGVMASANYYRRANGQELVDDDYFKQLIDENGIKWAFEIVIEIAKETNNLIMKDAEGESGKEKVGEKKSLR